MFANALGLFGAGVYLHALVESRGWPTGLVSGAITLFYVTSALLLIPVGGVIGRAGPQPIFALGGMALAARRRRDRPCRRRRGRLMRCSW